MQPDETHKNADRRRSSQRVFRYGVLVIGIVLFAAGTFFVGRRIYYRMIQPAPLWAVPTPKSETVVCADGFEIALWADETLVRNPSSICVDERGRVWVSEAVHYRDGENLQIDRSPSESKLQGGQPSGDLQHAGDQIVILDDTNRDGTADSRIVFAQDSDLVAPLGICVLGHQVFVSCSPGIYVFTDDNGDDRADRKEILLTGFGGHDHDHGVHGLVPGPDGRLYFTVGNAGPHVVTDKAGWTLRAGSYYQAVTSNSAHETGEQKQATLNTGGLVSDDGRVYVGGLVLSVLPDGSDLRVHSHNARNPYEVAVDSCGDVWQSDNDDTSSCRISWLMNGANTGFASADGSRSWQMDQRPGQSVPDAHWHQADPGVVPAGEIYGTGAPTGMMRCESQIASLPAGTLLACDAGLGCVNAFQPVPDGAGYRFNRSKLVWSEQESNHTDGRPDGLALTWFRPTDIAASKHKELFIADWYDSYVGGHRVNDEAAAGRIYVLRPKVPSHKPDSTNAVHRMSENSELEAPSLRSESAVVRWAARTALLRRGAEAVSELMELQNSGSTFERARALWILALLGEEGRKAVEADLLHEDSQIRITALRSLVAAGESRVELVSRLINDPAPSVQRELALVLRNVPLEESRTLLVQLAAQLDGNDRAATEAFGLACEGHEDSLYPELRLRLGNGTETWSNNFAAIVWRLHPAAALPDLQERLPRMSTDLQGLRQTLETIAFTHTQQASNIIREFADGESQSHRADNETSNSQISNNNQVASSPAMELAAWWAERLQKTGVLDASEIAAATGSLNVQFQPSLRTAVNTERVTRIAELEGDPRRGHDLFFGKKATCSACHRMLGQGADVGPNLTTARLRLDRQQLIEAILYPSNAILLGYESWSVADLNGKTAVGLLNSIGHDVVIKSADGKLLATPASEVEQLIRQNLSLMPVDLAKLLSEQEIADLVSFIKSDTTNP